MRKPKEGNTPLSLTAILLTMVFSKETLEQLKTTRDNPNRTMIDMNSKIMATNNKVIAISSNSTIQEGRSISNVSNLE